MVDTRTKIVGTAEAREFAATTGVTVVSGSFDPLLAAHAERLSGLKGDAAKLLVLIDTDEDAVLAARDRAELVAALRVVDWVSIGIDGIAGAIRLTDEHAETRDDLIRRVQARY